jgi:hypothetical protein
MRMDLLLLSLLFDAGSTCKGRWVHPLFWHVHHLVGVALILSIRIKMITCECNLGRHLKDRQGAAVACQGVCNKHGVL